MERSEILDNRRANLRALSKTLGGKYLAAMLGNERPTYVSQMAGPKAQRPVSEDSARLIESGLKLPLYTMDRALSAEDLYALVPSIRHVPLRASVHKIGVESQAPHSDAVETSGHSPLSATPASSEYSDDLKALVLNTIRKLSQICEVERVDIPTSKFGNLLLMAMQDTFRSGGMVQEDRIRDLVALVK